MVTVAFSLFKYIRTHFTLVLTTFKVAFVSTTVSPLKKIFFFSFFLKQQQQQRLDDLAAFRVQGILGSSHG